MGPFRLPISTFLAYIVIILSIIISIIWAVLSKRIDKEGGKKR